MGLHEIYIPDLELIVRFKLFSIEEGQLFCLDHEGSDPEEYKKAVLEHAIWNLKPDVTSKLKTLPKSEGQKILDSLYRAAVMLNPGMSFDTWLNLIKIDNMTDTEIEVATRRRAKRSTATAREAVSRSKFFGLERHLKERIVGQDEAIDEVVSALKRSQVGLHDPQRPLGVFLFAGASGVGKTLLAKELHKYLFEEKHDLVRIDCGEYQQKHENQKLIGAPPGYIGYDEGGQLTNQVEKNPDTVVLIDEVEKAHPDMLNTFLRIFDEGMVTDGHGKQVSFRRAIIIMTTNLGNQEIVDGMIGKRTGFANSLYINATDAKLPSRDLIINETEKQIRKTMRPEMINRIDKTVVFNHLGRDDYSQIAELELQVVQDKLSSRGYSIGYDGDVIAHIIGLGVNPVEGARKLSRLRRTLLEDPIADQLLSHDHPKGTVFQIAPEGSVFKIAPLAPVQKRRRTKKEATNTEEKVKEVV